MLLFVIFKDNYIISKISMFVNIINFTLLFNIMLIVNKIIKSIYNNKGRFQLKT